MWNDLFRYENGKLYWKPREGNDRGTKIFNTQFAGTEAGTTNNGYKQVKFDGSMYMLHRIIWEMHNGTIPEGMVIDHINFDSNDNRIENLQCITQADNVRRSQYKIAKGYTILNTPRPYQASRTGKHYGTPCGAYMSYKTAYL